MPTFGTVPIGEARANSVTGKRVKGRSRWRSVRTPWKTRSIHSPGRAPAPRPGTRIGHEPSLDRA